MDRQDSGKDFSKAMEYIRSLRDPIKRQFGLTYLTWIRAGRVGIAPSRGRLSPTLWRAVTVNLDTLS